MRHFLWGFLLATALWVSLFEIEYHSLRLELQICKTNCYDK